MSGDFADAAGNTPGVVVTDPEDFAQMERLRQIYDARQKVQTARQEADNVRAREDWPLWKKQDHVLAAYQRYYFEIEGLMERHPDGDYYLDEVKLGAISPPGELGEDYTKADIRRFEGLKSLARSFRPMPTDGYLAPQKWKDRTMEREVQVTVPIQIVTKAFRTINEFIAKVGLDATMAEEARDAGFNYGDILEEGPPGTGDPPQIDTAEDSEADE